MNSHNCGHDNLPDGHRPMSPPPSHVYTGIDDDHRRGDGLADTRPIALALRLGFVILLAVCLWVTATTRAHAEVETIMVPSAAMVRDIPVSFQPGGRHAVIPLDAFDAGAQVSNWVTMGGAMQTFAGKGISVVAPAGGAYSLYADREQDTSRKWETFLSSELPDWLAANKGLAADGHAIVGASQGGTAALTIAFYTSYTMAGGANGHFDFPTAGQHDRPSGGPQLSAMSDDVANTIR